MKGLRVMFLEKDLVYFLLFIWSKALRKILSNFVTNKMQNFNLKMPISLISIIKDHE